MSKDSLRKFYLSARKEIPSGIRGLKSEIIVQKVLESQWFREARELLCYLSLPDEVETDRILKEAIKQGKKVFVPVIKGEEIVPALLEDFDKLVAGPLGIRQPENPSLQPLAKLDLIIVPGIAFDRDLYRLGFGGGYFDRFLARYQNKARFLGLAFKEQIAEKIPREPWDIPLNGVLTDTSWLRS